MTVQSHIEALANRAILPQVEKDSIATSIYTLRSRLNAYFPNGISEQIQFGSSTRGTILPRGMDQRSDIDYLIVFKDDESRPQTYISRLKRFAEKYYTTSQIAQSHPTVVLKLNHISFDLVPAINSYWNEYQIPAPSSSYTDWLGTSPREFNTHISERNKNCSYKLKPAIRVLKYWNALSGYVFDSYTLEQWSTDQNFFFSTTVKDYFFDLINSLSLNWGDAQWKKDRVQRAQRIVRTTQDYLRQNLPLSAEIEIKKLVP